MEMISIDGLNVAVQEVARPAGWQCRLLQTAAAQQYILGYLVSVGPYQIDVERFHLLSEEQARLYQAGQLDLASLAKELAGE